VASQGSVILPLYRRLIENPNVSCDCRRRLWLKTAGGGVGQQVCTSLQLLNALQFTPSKGFKLLMSLIFFALRLTIHLIQFLKKNYVSYILL
jgi:hypothetical protein